MGEYTQRLRQLLTQGGLTALDARDGMVAAYLVISRINQLQGNPEVGLKQDEAGLYQHLSGFMGAIFWERGYNYDHPTVEQLSEIKMMMDGIAQVYAMPDNLQMAVNEINDFLLARAANQPALVSPSIMDLLEYQTEPDLQAPTLSEREPAPATRPPAAPDDDLMPEPKDSHEIEEPAVAEAPEPELAREPEPAAPQKPVLDPELVALFDEAMKEETVPAAPSEPAEEPAAEVLQPQAEEPVGEPVAEVVEPRAEEPAGFGIFEAQEPAASERFATAEASMPAEEPMTSAPETPVESPALDLPTESAPATEPEEAAAAPDTEPAVRKKRVRKKALEPSEPVAELPKKKGKPGRKPKNAASVVVPDTYMAESMQVPEGDRGESTFPEPPGLSAAEEAQPSVPEEHLTWDTVGTMPVTQTGEAVPPAESAALEAEPFAVESSAMNPEAPVVEPPAYPAETPAAAAYAEPEPAAPAPEPEPAWAPAPEPSKPRIEFGTHTAPAAAAHASAEVETESDYPEPVKPSRGLPLFIGILVGLAVGAVGAWMVASQMNQNNEAQLRASFDKQLQAVKAETTNAKAETEKLQANLKNLEAAWRKPPDKPTCQKVGSAALLYWPNEGMMRKYFLYRAKGAAGNMMKVNEEPLAANFMVLSKPEPGAWRFAVSALTQDGVETDKSDALAVAFPLR